MAGRPSISFFINECGRLPYSSANIRNSLEKHNNNPDYYTFRHIKTARSIHFSTHDDGENLHFLTHNINTKLLFSTHKNK